MTDIDFRVVHRNLADCITLCKLSPPDDSTKLTMFNIGWQKLAYGSSSEFLHTSFIPLGRGPRK